VIAERFELDSPSREDTGSLARRLRALSSAPPELGQEVRDILAAVFQGGDAAVVELTRRFDSESAPDELAVASQAIEQAITALDHDVREGLELAIQNVRIVAEAEQPRTASATLPQGQHVELRDLPVRRVGAYVPGGRAAYPSSLVMCCVPARVAGVEQLAVTTPPGQDGRATPLVLAACALCEVDEIYLCGGAQAIGALAFGTETIDPVDVIVGPGSHYVQEAKRQVSGLVGIDGIAGPSELVVIADADAVPRLVALDLAAQSEHGADTLLVLISPYDHVLDAVERELLALAETHETVSDAPVALVEVRSLEVALALANAIAPEHLELACADAERLADGVRTSGCVFLGIEGGAAFGDYVAGSNHVLPTGGAARFTGPLGPGRFRRTQALVSLPAAAARALAQPASSVAYAEGFPLHAESTLARANLDGGEGEH
jgi:histidinol dehydrogenase